MQRIKSLLLLFTTKHILIYNGLYKFHRFLRKKVFNVEDIFGWIIAIFVLCSSLFSLKPSISIDNKSSLNQNIGFEDFKPIYIYLFIVILYWMIGKIIQLRVKNTGVMKKFSMPGTYLIRKNKDKSCILDVKNINNTEYEFATEEKANLTAELNIKGYERGPWGTNYQEKLERNLSHIKKNKYSIMFFRFENQKNIIGFTHVLPVSFDTWNDYTKGLINDNEFTDNYITSNSSKYINEKPYGLILFSVVCTEVNFEKYNPAKEKEYEQYLGIVLEKAIVFHIDKLLKVYFSADSNNSYSKVNVLLQNEDENCYKNFFKDCSNMDCTSADGCTIINFKVHNNYI